MNIYYYLFLFLVIYLCLWRCENRGKKRKYRNIKLVLMSRLEFVFKW